MDDEIRRLKRFILLTWTALIIFVIGLVSWASIQAKNAKNIALSASSRPVSTIQGLQGPAGKDGLSIQGPQGEPGKNAETIVRQETIQTNVPVPGEKGDKGEPGQQGVPGTAGREVELGKDVLGNVIWRYTGDSIWQTLEVMQ